MYCIVSVSDAFISVWYEDKATHNWWHTPNILSTSVTFTTSAQTGTDQYKQQVNLVTWWLTHLISVTDGPSEIHSCAAVVFYSSLLSSIVLYHAIFCAVFSYVISVSVLESVFSVFTWALRSHWLPSCIIAQKRGRNPLSFHVIKHSVSLRTNTFRSLKSRKDSIKPS